MYAYIQLSFTIFLNKIIFYFLVQHMRHFLLETFAFINNDVFEKSNEFSTETAKLTKNKISRSV